MKKIDTKEFINRGKYFTKGLFVEFQGYGDNPVYTLAREDVPPYHSLYQLYMKEGDPTESRFVEKYLYDLKHWELLCSLSWFKPYIKEWRKELNLRLHSDLVFTLIQDSFNEESKSNTTSAKYLLDNYFRDKATKAKTKTPTEEVVDKDVKKVFLEDAERIGIFSGTKVN